MNFEEELRILINKASKENDSDTPDWILASYLEMCLEVFTKTTRRRDKWYDFNPWSRSDRKEVRSPNL